jgi:RHH-type transcriptional regulator, proline utilization regulon repressor / proline dehydrogenase / delta 1-pyrroline-5-carboxylate dehydrogenase
MALKQPMSTAARGLAAPPEEAVRELGREILRRAGSSAPSLFDPRAWESRLLDRAMKDEQFKTDLFRFIDVLPTLRDDPAVARHVQEYLLKEGRTLPLPVASALKAAGGGPLSGAAARAMRALASRMGSRFIAGSSPADALPALRRLHGQGLSFSADLLGEVTLCEADADACARKYAQLIDTLADETQAWPEDEVADRNDRGPLPRANISVKLSSLSPHLDPVDHEGSLGGLMRRVLPLLVQAKGKGVAVYIDLEQWELHDLAYDLFEQAAADASLKDWPHLGIVVQAYLVDAAHDLERLRRIARERGSPLTVRLVKGAYWDHEVAHARQHGLACPVLVGKGLTDASFESLSIQLLQSPDLLLPGFGSHNARSVACALAAARCAGLPRGALEVQMLLGMAEPQRAALREMGYRVRVYSPIGELLPGIAYLVRRLLEGTANRSFLRLTWHEKLDPEHLLSRPEPPSTEARAQGGGMRSGDLTSPFENCPPTDFRNAAERQDFRAAVQSSGSSLPLRVPVVIDGKERFGGSSLTRLCPSDGETVTGIVTMAAAEEADAAARSAMEAWPEWRERPLQERATILETLAGRLEHDRHELAALECFEVGKPMREADADVAEAVDFCRYYARMALGELGERALTSMVGEENRFAWQGRGPTAVIAPWNFPLSILCGMSAAALVAGNTILMKPAEQSSGTAFRLYRHMMAAGFPPDVVQFLPGAGEVVGSRLVAHPLVAQIAFTGSRSVGCAIWARAGETAPGQPRLKRVVCEMGGKNAIIVDDDADLDEAVFGVIRSAFGYAGQKCSACSRVIVVGSAFDAFASRLAAAAGSLVMAPAHQARCELGPVIDEEAWRRLRGVLAEPGDGAEPLFVGIPPTPGFFIPPAVFHVTDVRHRLMQEELFGPVLALLRVGSFEEALAAAVGTDYALTGGVYSRSPANLLEARRRFNVGNLYLNRPTTGALVGRQPFGGFGMSGGGTKSGGPGYLLQFAEPRSVCENTERRGFLPDLGDTPG